MRGTGKKFTGAVAKQRNCGLGKAIQNAKINDKNTKPEYSQKHSQTEFLAANGQSVVDEGDFLDIIAKAHLENRDFTAQRDLRVVDPNADTTTVKPTSTQLDFMNENKKLLRVPRRPQWTKQMTKEQVEQNELTEFYKWRQALSFLEENRTVHVTPFEKNLDFWRQLWRVVEFSDLIFQIVDARNPLMFYSPDLFQYAKEVSLQYGKPKQMIVILNKADLVPLELRQKWSDYFTEKKIQHLFFSALREEALLKYLFNLSSKGIKVNGIENGVREGNINVEQLQVDVESESEESQKDQDNMTERTAATTFSSKYMQEYNKRTIKKEKRQQMRLANQAKVQQHNQALQQEVAVPEVLLSADDSHIPLQFENNVLPEFLGSPKIITRQQLLQLVEIYRTKYQPANSTRPYTTGTIGFPNIGKSSIINVLSIETGLRTAVGDTPGKTKHFQTIQLSPQIQLCDCPGLIFPSFSHLRADFVLNGVLPVDKERDYVGYLRLLCKRIPARVFNKLYQLEIKPEDKFKSGVGMTYGQAAQVGEFYCDYMQLLLEFEAKLGMERGVVGRKLVKDLFKGKLLWIALPPISKKKIVKMSDAEYMDIKKMKLMEVDDIPIDQMDDEEFGEEGAEEEMED
ncbi:GTP-binding_protein [Hexamita inflata]|uniref:GTP-binding protein n=1 Tax=Hexamita inflata TaxID=28002 RepID=A0AA86TAQ8_9EUKA|nr:GTP-binding protein [Hexamita inflata]